MVKRARMRGRVKGNKEARSAGDDGRMGSGVMEVMEEQDGRN